MEEAGRGVERKMSEMAEDREEIASPPEPASALLLRQREKVSSRYAVRAAKAWVREQTDLPVGVYARWRGWADGQRNFEVGYDTRAGRFMRILNLRVGSDYVPVVARDRRDRRQTPQTIDKPDPRWVSAAAGSKGEPDTKDASA